MFLLTRLQALTISHDHGILAGSQCLDVVLSIVVLWGNFRWAFV